MPDFNPGAASSLNDAVKRRYEANPDTNAFTDAEKALLAALEEHGHTVATSAADGFMDRDDKAKLDGIAEGATANQTDNYLRNRENHQGTQIAATISDLAEAVDDRVAALLQAGANVTLTYDDAAGRLIVAFEGGEVLWDNVGSKPTTFPPAAHDHPASAITNFGEAVDDRVATLLNPGTNIAIAYDDTTGRVSVSAPGLVKTVPGAHGGRAITNWILCTEEEYAAYLADPPADHATTRYTVES